MAGIATFNEAALERRDAKRRAGSSLAVTLAGAACGFCVLVAVAIVGAIVWKGVPAMTWEFVSTGPREGMSAGGIWPMIRGSLLLMVGTMALVLPIGVLAGIWLAEYAKEGRLASLTRSCVATLAGTPSIIFGLFGLAIFVLKFELGTSLVAGWLTLTVFALPVVVIATETAFRGVPESFRDAATSLGLTRWQSIWKVMLPAAMPGIATGVVLTAGRAAGEAPPILLTAGIYYSTERLTLGFETLKRPVANLPYHLAEGYRQGGVIPENILWGTCLTLMLLVLAVNALALYSRARARARRKW